MNLRKIQRHKYKFFAVGVFILIVIYSLKSQEAKDGVSQSQVSRLQRDAQQNATKLVKTFLVVLILTGPANKDRRDAIRETWLSDAVREKHSEKSNSHAEILHYFIVGTKDLKKSAQAELKKENHEHGDMLLLEQFADAYKKLTEKVGLSLRWLHENVDYRYVFKGDDDTFVRLDVLKQELKDRQSSKPNEKLYYGYFYGRSHVKKAGPWKETEWKLCDYYIPYARGGGYILSSNVVSYLATNFNLFKQYLSEDVSMGSWLAPLEVERVHDIRFDTEYKTRGCSNTFVVSHKQSIDDMYDKWRSLKTTGKLCEQEVSVFHGYEYNWDVAPSQCCVRMTNIP